MDDPQRIISLRAEDLILGLKRDKERQLSRVPSGDRSKAVYIPDADRRRRAVMLVEECFEENCPPPPKLIEALWWAFLDSERSEIGAETLREEFQIRLLSGEIGIAPKMYHAFKRAAECEAASAGRDEGGALTLNATEYAVAKAAGCDRGSVRKWRDPNGSIYPHYLRMIEQAVPV